MYPLCSSGPSQTGLALEDGNVVRVRLVAVSIANVPPRHTKSACEDAHGQQDCDNACAQATGSDYVFEKEDVNANGNLPDDTTDAGANQARTRQRSTTAQQVLVRSLFPRNKHFVRSSVKIRQKPSVTFG